MEKLTDFVSEHLDADIQRLILDRDKWPDIDMDLAVSCIESRRKIKSKVPEWYSEPALIFPRKLSAEQCSSSNTAIYKSMLADEIVSADKRKDKDWKIADLTGGLGVDSWFFSKKAAEVLYNEMEPALCRAADHNFKILGAGNITISENEIHPGMLKGLLDEFKPDIVYMDPARRGAGGKKVFLIEDCTPDVLKLKDEIFTVCRHILLKLSPMADISMACTRLGSTCRQVHAVETGGECKELLIWMDREWNGEYEVTASVLKDDGEPACFSFRPSEEKEAKAVIKDSAPAEGEYMFEPCKAIMKAGAFNMTSQRFGLKKSGVSTHYYFTDDFSKVEELKKYGKVYMIRESHILNKRTIKETGKNYPHSEVTARNISMDTDTLRKKLGVTSGDDAHIFGLGSDLSGKILLVADRL